MSSIEYWEPLDVAHSKYEEGWLVLFVGNTEEMRRKFLVLQTPDHWTYDPQPGDFIAQDYDTADDIWVPGACDE